MPRKRRWTYDFDDSEKINLWKFYDSKLLLLTRRELKNDLLDEFLARGTEKIAASLRILCRFSPLTAPRRIAPLKSFDLLRIRRFLQDSRQRTVDVPIQDERNLNGKLAGGLPNVKHSENFVVKIARLSQ